MSGAFWRPDAEGIRVTVKVTPRARKPGLRGVVPGADGARLAIAVTEAPEAGAANRAACAALAAALGVTPAAVSVVAGATAREKRLAVVGDPATLAARVAAL